MASPTANGHVEFAPLLSPKPHHKHHIRESVKRFFKEKLEHSSVILRLLWEVLKFIVGLVKCLLKFLIAQLVKRISTSGWQEVVSSSVINILNGSKEPLHEFGKGIQEIGNDTLDEYTTVDGKHKYKRTIIGLLDTEAPALLKETLELFPSPTPGSRPNGDVCVMAAKIIYEDPRIVKDIINNVWNTQAVVDGKVVTLGKPLEGKKYNEDKGEEEGEDKFEFVEWYPENESASNDSKVDKSKDTQAMIFRKGPAIVLAFRGTEPFNSDDWATDFYFPWHELPAVGRVHLGFLQALGLGSPTSRNPPKEDAKDKVWESQKLDGFSRYMKRQVKQRARGVALTADGSAKPLAGEDATKINAEKGERKDAEGKKQPSSKQKSSKKLTPDEKNVIFRNKYVEETLYIKLKEKLEGLLRADVSGKAHLFITGHSLGGALAALFTGLLVAESEFMEQRISGLFTFGQPRIGDWTFAWSLHCRLNNPQHRYVRMIYGQDLVPRVPFDTDIFEFKHLGPFHWVDAFYHIRIGTFEDQPRLNVFTAHFRAFFELWYNWPFNWFANEFIRAEKKKRSEEGFFQILSRTAILVLLGLPVLGAHSPINYVNAVRYGMPEAKVKDPPAPAVSS